ncbi:hypothetical protein COV49_03240 [Candidatus Falkowbacteria bacterium CG11_big_fil_rev_8_21_14_0_20_39_10]|uniref:DUF3784 domain-containing protein n=1 Tax=Candidatus Falkowbacteria bacterium CG11_big_fil_rev_8_21_14_0_20_39_10 TaxID=1974570 RepID=A0A2M6K8F4_9BACT|nr:MAG: hypothetical protein COV49_03240 [Candidatus Falkowbacteria bacterium CG11_big_fil_rev_8_21_14_0_20_39_10]
MNILVGLILIIVGALIVIKSEWLLDNFGRIGFFEQHLGTEGGSRLGYKLVGILTIFIGILIMTGMIGGFLTWLLSPILKFSQVK